MALHGCGAGGGGPYIENYFALTEQAGGIYPHLFSVYVDSVNGSDVTGDGKTIATAFKTHERLVQVINGMQSKHPGSLGMMIFLMDGSYNVQAGRDWMKWWRGTFNWVLHQSYNYNASLVSVTITNSYTPYDPGNSDTVAGADIPFLEMDAITFLTPGDTHHPFANFGCDQWALNDDIFEIDCSSLGHFDGRQPSLTYLYNPTFKFLPVGSGVAGTQSLVQARGGAIIQIDGTTTLLAPTSGSTPNTVNFSDAVAAASGGGQIDDVSTWSVTGTVTGTRFKARGGGVICVPSADVNHFPGNSAGVVSTAGAYGASFSL
jgi:hypothetical protein